MDVNVILLPCKPAQLLDSATESPLEEADKMTIHAIAG